jgi:hypothetical protein
MVCAARTGSTMLRWMLDSHPDICCHGEVFGSGINLVGINKKLNPPIYQMLNEIKDQKPVRFLFDFVLYPGSYKAVGVKIKYEELGLPKWKAVFNAVVADRSIRIIHLTRENHLKRYISNYIATHITYVNVIFDEGQQPVVQPVTLSPELCIEDIIATEKAENKFREYFKNHRVFDISYEQLIDIKDKKLNDLQHFLGVTPTKLQIKTKKVISDNLKDLLANYSDFQSAFIGTRFERYLSI